MMTSRQKFASVPPSSFAARLPQTAEIENRMVVMNAANIDCSLAVAGASELRDLLQQRRRRLPRHPWQDDDFATQPFDEAAFVLVDGVDRVVAALGVNVWPDRFKELHRRRLAKDANAVHARQRGEHERAVVLGIDRAAGTFEVAHARVGVETDEQRVAL